MTIAETLDVMEEMLEKSWSLPLSGGKTVVDMERMIDLIDELRRETPTEIRQAKMIVADRQDIIREAKEEAEKMIRDAELKAKRLISDEQIVKEAKNRANQMITQAQTQAMEIKHMTNNYVEKILTQSEETLLKNLQELKSAHSAIRRAAK